MKQCGLRRYSRDPRIRMLRRWRMPTEADIGESGLPCECYPSDHLSLCAEFEIASSGDSADEGVSRGQQS